MQGDFTFAAYTIRIAGELTAQLNRFVTLNPHQLAGQVANMEFWADEAAHCLRVIDGYKSRFHRLSDAQAAHADARHTVEFDLDQDPEEILRTYPPSKPHRIPDSDRLLARRELCDAFYRFIVRCHKAGLINKDAARRICARLDISIDPNDLQGRCG